MRRRDYIVAADGVKVNSPEQVKEIVKTKKIGSELVLKILRDEVELDLTVEVDRKEKVDCEIYPVENPNQLQLNIPRGWLQGWTNHDILN